MLLAFIFLQLLHQTLAASGGSHWTYEGPHGQEHWRETYEACGWDAQSPVDIDTSLVQYDPSLTPVEPEGYREPGDASFSLQNNGHTVQMSLPPSLSLYGLPSLYRAVQLHLHWGSKAHGAGSEHLVNGRAFPAELHVVHFNADKYANVSEALQQADGLAVLGVFLEVGDEANPAYDRLLEHLEDIEYAEQKISIAPFNVRELLPAHLGRYYRYNGSLTTPPCFQSVLWTVFEQPARVSAGQLEKLEKSIYASKSGVSPRELLENNFRSTQPLNKRVILSSFPIESTGHSAGTRSLAHSVGWLQGGQQGMQVRSSPSFLGFFWVASVSSWLAGSWRREYGETRGTQEVTPFLPAGGRKGCMAKKISSSLPPLHGPFRIKTPTCCPPPSLLFPPSPCSTARITQIWGGGITLSSQIFFWEPRGCGVTSGFGDSDCTKSNLLESQNF